MESTYILVDKSVAPEVFVKVVDAKKKLSSGRYKTINDALAAANISRSAFYKYKNYVFAHTKFETEQLVTLFFTLDDVAGILSDILILLSSEGANILTINQNIPGKSYRKCHRFDAYRRYDYRTGGNDRKAEKN